MSNNFIHRVDASVIADLGRIASSENLNRNLMPSKDSKLDWAEYNIKLSELSTLTSKLYNLSGFGLVVGLSSDVGANVMCRFGNGSKEVRLSPGMKFKGRFNKIGLRLADDGVAIGTMRLLILETPDVDFVETLLTDTPPSVQQVMCQISATTLGQAYNAAKFANNPTALNTEALRNSYALNAARCRKMVAFVYSVGAPNITAGTLLLWQYDTELGNWFASSIEIPLQTGTPRVCTGAFEVGPNIGWIWAEVYGLTNAVGIGDSYVFLRGS